MAKNYRQDRIGEEIRRIISEMLLSDLKDPRLDSMISITDVEVTRDNSYATVYFSPLGVKGSEEELKAKTDDCLRAARQGAVLVSPAISRGEKVIMRAAFEEGLPLIYLKENGFTDLAKPGGKRMDACARGQLLILAPWEHHNEKLTIKRGQCLALNEMARAICEG